MSAPTAAPTAATNATAGRRRTAAPRAPPELAPYKVRFNAYLQQIGLPSVDDLTPEDVENVDDISSIMCLWAEHMMANPPRHAHNPNKLLKSDGVGNGFGLIKEYLKDRFSSHVDWNDESWFTLSKGALVKKLERDSVRGTSGIDEVPGKIGIVRLNPDADLMEGHDGISTGAFADEVPDQVTIIRKLLKTSKLGNKNERRLALNLTSAADGRFGEVKYLNYQGMACDPVGSCVASEWKDLKNGTNRPTTFCADYDRWETCVFDSLGDHWSVDGGLSRTCNSSGNIGFLQAFVVPMCHARSDAWTSKMITDTLRDGMPDAVQDSVSGRSLRYGSTTHLHEDPSVNHPELTARSGHAPADNSRHYEMTKYRLAMRVASAAVTEDQEKVFRAAEIDDAELVRNAKALDEDCRKWIAAKLGRGDNVGRLTAKVLGLGANARNVPHSAWPRPTGGLFGGIFRRNNN